MKCNENMEWNGTMNAMPEWSALRSQKRILISKWNSNYFMASERRERSGTKWSGVKSMEWIGLYNCCRFHSHFTSRHLIFKLRRKANIKLNWVWVNAANHITHFMLACISLHSIQSIISFPAALRQIYSTRRIHFVSLRISSRCTQWIAFRSINL